VPVSRASPRKARGWGITFSSEKMDEISARELPLGMDNVFPFHSLSE